MYDRKCPFEMHVIDEQIIEKVGHPVQCAEDIIVKILVKVSVLAPDRLRITDQSDEHVDVCY